MVVFATTDITIYTVTPMIIHRHKEHIGMHDEELDLRLSSLVSEIDWKINV